MEKKDLKVSNLEILDAEKEEGASLVEYALLVALIAIAAMLAITFLGKQVSDRFNTIGTKLQEVN